MTQWEPRGAERSLMATRHAALIAFARRLVDADTADDLVQEAFVRVMEGGRSDANDLPLSYFKVVVRNLAIDTYSRRSREEVLARKSSALGAGTVSSGADTPQFQEDLRERMAELSQRQWESLVMTVVLGMTENEAASAAHVSRSAVTGSRDRALQWLRDAVQRTNPGNSGRIAG